MYQAARLNLSGSTIRTAISFYGNRISFDQVFVLIDALAESFSARFHIGKGDTITLCMPNSPSALLAFYAANKLGAAVNLVHPYIPPEKLSESAKKTDSKLIVVYDAYPHAGEEKPAFGVPVLESDCGWFMGAAARAYYRMTNKKLGWGEKLEKLLKKKRGPSLPSVNFAQAEPGSLSRERRHHGRAEDHRPQQLYVQSSVFQGAGVFERTLENYVSLYNVLPIFHGFGLCINMHMCMIMRRTNIMCIKFDAKRCARQIQKERANILTGVPTMYLKLMGEKTFTGGDLSSIKDVFVGGDSAPRALIEKFDEVLKRGNSNAHMYEGYGLTETVTVCLVNTREHNRPGSIGYPLSDTRVCIVKNGKKLPAGEVGEIYIRTPLFMQGYLGNGEQPFERLEGETWLKTGDYGYLDEDGFLYFKQRIKNMIKVSGVPVYPSEIESVALLCPKVKKACAVGVSDTVKGQVVKLYVESADGDSLKEELLSLCRAKLIAYAVPKFIEVRDRLPVNLIGKIDRKSLEEENPKNT